MRRFIFYLFLLPFCVFAQQNQRGYQEEGVPISDPKGTLLFSYKASHALLIGVSQYEAQTTWRPLPGVKADLDSVKTVLETVHGFQVEVLMDGTRKQILEKIDDFIARYGLTKSNRLLFWIAGHGYTITEVNDSKGYFIPKDTPAPKDKTGSTPEAFYRAAIDLSEIEANANRIQANHVLFLFDACFAGNIIQQMRDGGTSSGAIQAYMKDPVRMIITSGSANETVPDQSIFSRSFVKALRGQASEKPQYDGYLTGTELGIYLTESSLNEQGPTVQLGRLRKPSQQGDYVFALPQGPCIPPQNLQIKHSDELRVNQSAAFQAFIPHTPSPYFPYSYVWDLGDGSTRNGEEIHYAYTREGSYTIKLSVAACGKTENITRQITVGKACTPPKIQRITLPKTGFVGEPLRFEAQGSGDALLYQWTFGKGSSLVNLSETTHTFDQAGEYSVRLTLTNACGSDQQEDKIQVRSKASQEAKITGIKVLTPPFAGKALQFEAITTVPEMELSWTFGDGGVQVIGKSPRHTYPKPGTYKVSVLGFIDGALVSYNQDLVVQPNPCKEEGAKILQVYAPKELITDKPLTFMLEGNDPSMVFRWDWGKGFALQSGQTVSQRFSQAGTYTLTISGQGQCGEDQKTFSFVIAPADPCAANTPSITKLNLPKKAKAQKNALFSALTTGQDLRYTWTWGDGSTSTEAQPKHRYTQAQTYELSLEVENACGVAKLSSSITIDQRTSPLLLGLGGGATALGTAAALLLKKPSTIPLPPQRPTGN